MFVYGLGPSVYSVLTTLIINPNNIKANVPLDDGKSDILLFDPEIANRTPGAIRMMAYVCLAQVLIALLILRRNQDEVS